MSSDVDSLRALEDLMTEFFAVSTTNDRKREIEALLGNFGQQKGAWKHCLYFLANTSNDYVMMYGMNVLEKLINCQWVGLQGPDRVEIRSTLNSFLLTHHQDMPSYLRNKLVKLVVDIGRLDWPHFYPDFFSSILALIQQTSTCSLGLILLHTASEELACPREDLSVSRKEELHRLLLHQIPTILSILNNILSSILERHRSMVTATPPPSPTQGRSQMSLSVSPVPTSSIISSSPVQSRDLMTNLFKSPQSRVQTESLPPLDSQSQYIAHLALNCLSHLFSWIPLSATITPNLLSTVFFYAAFGCDPSPVARGGALGYGTSPGLSGNVSATAGCSPHHLGILAMDCINELLAKNCVPQEFEDFLLQMFQQTFYLLQRITKDSTTNSSGNRLAELDDTYVEKFTDFLRLFVSIHIRRFEANKQFPVSDFLALFFRYTFKQPNNEGFFACLDTWTVFLDYIATQLQIRAVDRESLLQKYQEPLSSLLTHILQKVQFRYSQSQLDELDDETLDDDEETEWQHYLRQCLETVAKISELFPSETFQILYVPFQENLSVYLSLQQYISSDTAGTRTLNISVETECRRLHCTLRDLSSLLQAMGRLADHFIGEKYVASLNDATALMERLLYTAAYGTKMKLYEVQSTVSNVLQADVIEVHAQSLATVKAFASWLAQFYLTSSQDETQKTQGSHLVTTLLETIIPLFAKDVPEKVSQAAAHLLLSLLCTVRPSSLLSQPLLQNFYRDVSQGSLSHCSQGGSQCSQLELIVYRSLSHYLLLPWPGCNDTQQMWDMRAAHHQNFVHKIVDKYWRLANTHSHSLSNKTAIEQGSTCVRWSMAVLTDLVKTISADGVSKSKQICYQSLDELVQITLTILPVYLGSMRKRHEMLDTTDDILGFFLALFQSLRVQMGVPFTKQVIQTFITVFTGQHLSETIAEENRTGYRVIEKFLHILQMIVQEPSTNFKAFLPNVLDICMKQIYPIIAERAAPDIKPSLYALLHQLLLNNWRYFFKGGVLKSLQDTPEDMDNQPQFLAVMQAFGQSFLQPDIDVFRQNLEALESLNHKWKLYSKKVFRELMLFQFLNVLLQVLVHKSHNLLQEEIGITVYNMAAVDFDAFYATFLPQFLANCDGLDSNQKAVLSQNFRQDKDLPSFTQNAHRFVNDLRYYRLCNSSLPEGSVKL